MENINHKVMKRKVEEAYKQIDWVDHSGKGKRIKVNNTTLVCFNTGTMQLQGNKGGEVYKRLEEMRTQVDNMSYHAKIEFVSMSDRIDTLEHTVKVHDKTLECLSEYCKTQNKEIKKLKWSTECKPSVYEGFLMWTECVLKDCVQAYGGDSIRSVAGHKITSPTVILNVVLGRSEKDCLKFKFTEEFESFVKNELPLLFGFETAEGLLKFAIKIGKCKRIRAFYVHKHPRNVLNNVILEIDDDFLTTEDDYLELCDNPIDLSTIKTFREMVETFKSVDGLVQKDKYQDFEDYYSPSD